MYILENCGTNRVFRHFEDISRIPRGSGNEAAVSEYIKNFALNLGLYAKQDADNNVIIRKGGTLGLENAPCVILQGHLDMVCEKNNGTVHDFEKDPLDLFVDGDYIRAKGTTLGADNGIAVAIAMALLESRDIAHPPLEVVLTVNEEVGLLGAVNLSPSDLSGKYLINLDSEEEGVFYTSCAGGIKASMHVPISNESLEGLGLDGIYKLSVSGLRGGHSGMDIDKERANANKLLGRVLYSVLKEKSIRLISIKGGAKDNAIPREAEAFFAASKNDLCNMKEIAGKYAKIFKDEFRTSDSSIKLNLEILDEKVNIAFDTESTKRVIYGINLIKNGVFSMSSEIDNLVESSSNLGVITPNRNEVILASAVRSCLATKKEDILSQLYVISDVLGADLVTHGDYPAWEYKSESSFRQKFIDVYKKMYNAEPKIAAIHAGLECGLFAEKVNDIEMISLGPNMYDVHTPDERLSISSVNRFWEFLVKVLGILN